MLIGMEPGVLIMQQPPLNNETIVVCKQGLRFLVCFFGL